MSIGICGQIIVPLRAEAAHKSEMISQLLFGETYDVLLKSKEWIKIKCHYDSYEGFIHEKQHIPITPAALETLDKNQKQLSFEVLQRGEIDGEAIYLPLGSVLPEFDGLNFKFLKQKGVFTGQALEMSLEKNEKHLDKIYTKYMNAPYLWGGRTPLGIDCSGFTQMVYKFLGIKLPRDAYQQAAIGKTINFVEESRVGDLAFFGDSGKITHVGLIIENNKIVHASGKVRIDILDNFGIFNAEEKKYSHSIKQIKRYF